MIYCVLFFAICASLFPLTDTDIWWHLACAREWVNTWTPYREPIVNVHAYFQKIVAFIFDLGGAPFLVFIKSLLWGSVFYLFLRPFPKKVSFIFAPIFFAFLILFRYEFEIRPILFTLLFYGLFLNLLPIFFNENIQKFKKFSIALSLLIIEFIWCKIQGLFILGIFEILLFYVLWLLEYLKKHAFFSKRALFYTAFSILFCFIPLSHKEHFFLLCYPFELLNRLVGLAPSAQIFATQIAENKSPLMLLLDGNFSLSIFFMCILPLTLIFVFLFRIYQFKRGAHKKLCIQEKAFFVYTFIFAILSLLACRNFVLFLPCFFVFLFQKFHAIQFPKNYLKYIQVFSFCLLFSLTAFWLKSLKPYDKTMISKERVPVEAALWLKHNPHKGHLFNDDRAGGYLSFVNPEEQIYIDGRFILKTSEFFKRYLEYRHAPQLFLQDAQALGIDRAIFPVRYYAYWNLLLLELFKNPDWKCVYRDEFYIIFDKE